MTAQEISKEYGVKLCPLLAGLVDAFLTRLYYNYRQDILRALLCNLAEQSGEPQAIKIFQEQIKALQNSVFVQPVSEADREDIERRMYGVDTPARYISDEPVREENGDGPDRSLQEALVCAEQNRILKRIDF